MRTRIAVAALALLCSACASGGPGISGDLRNVGGVTTTFKVSPARVRAGQTVRFTYRLVNNAGRDERLTFPTGQQYDFWATRGDDEVWRWSEDRVFVQAITRETIAPQSSLTFSEPWTPESQGTYVVHGALTAEGYRRELTGELRVE